MKSLAIILVFAIAIAAVIGARFLLDSLVDTDPNIPPLEQIFESENAPPAMDGDSKRSSKWPAVRRQYIEKHPACEACGRSDRLVVHHIVPFSVDPSLELVESNLITLCAQFEDSDSDGSNEAFNCHFRIGHDPDGPDGPRGPNWKLSNPNVWRDARQHRDSLATAP